MNSRRILISCLNEDAGLYCLNPESGYVFQVHNHPSRGLCRFGVDGLFAQVVDDRDLMVFRFDGGRWGKRQDFFRIEDCHSRSDIHDVFYDGESLWCVQTARDCAYKLGKDFRVERTTGIRPHKKDTIHWNTISVNQGVVYGCSFCNVGHRWRDDPLNGGIFFRVEGGTLHVFENIKPLHTPHTLRIEGDTATICSSMTGDLVICKIASDGQWYIAEKHFVGSGYLRGSCRFDQGWVLGLSTPRGKSDQRARVVYMDEYGYVIDAWEIPAYDIYELLVI